MKIKIPLSKVMPTGAFSIVTFNNKSYVTPAWQEVPMGTKFSDIEIIKPKEPKVVPYRSVHMVKGSSNSEYTVVIDTKLGNSCTCVGFQYHRNCKHIKNILNLK